MTQPTDMFGTLLADVATRVSREALRADPAARARLQQLQGSTVELQCTLPAATWHISIDTEGLNTYAGAAPAPQAIVRGSLGSFARWLAPGGSLNDLEINGDTTLLLALTDILKDFRPDLWMPLQAFLGEETAATLLGGAEAGVQALRSLLQGTGASVQAQATRRYLQHAHLNDFLQRIDQLRLRVDRLDARLGEVERHHGGGDQANERLDHGR